MPPVGNNSVVARRSVTDFDASFYVASLVGSLVVWLAGWRGSDWPAALFRVELFDRSGFTIWNPYWYAGHHVPAYSVLFPPLADLLGIGTIAISSTVVSIVLFGRLARTHLEHAAAPLLTVFGAGMIANLAIGRLPFALGAAFALAGLVALDRRHPVWAVLAAVLASLSSPLAGAFLVLALVAWALADPRGRAFLAGIVAVGAMVPIFVFFEVFPQEGWFPYRGDEFLGTLALAGGIYLVAPRGWREIRFGALIVMVAAVPLFAFPNAIGGNMVRLVGVIGIPLAGAVLWSLRRRFVVLVVPLMVWQLGPAMSSFHAPAEASADASYYEPMVTAVSRLTDGAPTRIEIPFTASHWEAAYAGPHLMLARGWERQTDRALNAELYEDDLLHSEYQAWLLDNAVSYVALPAVELDPGSVREAELIASHPVYLELVWSSADWQVFEVLRAEPLASAGAVLTSVEPDTLDLFVGRAGTYELRFQFSDHLSVTSGNGCLYESENGWTEFEARSGGFVRLSSAVSEVDRCADAPAEDP